LPLTDADRAADYGWELSMRQVEVSRTLVFDVPRRARRFFEALVADNLGIGRPEVIELIFRRGQRRGRPAAGEFKTKIVTYGTEVNVNAIYRHSRIKQYLKDRRALRIETVVNDPAIWAACGACTIWMSCRPAPVPSTGGCSILNVSARAASLRVQPLSGSHSPPSPGMAAGPRPYGSATLGSKPWPAPYAPPRRLTGITNKNLRALMTGLLGGANYSMNQASYDLTRLRVNALITRIPGRNRYRLTSEGLAFAIFYTKVHDRLLRPLLAAYQPPAPPPIRKALHTIDTHIAQRIEDARLLPTAAGHSRQLSKN
jgi:hypothetical protein